MSKIKIEDLQPMDELEFRGEWIVFMGIHPRAPHNNNIIVQQAGVSNYTDHILHEIEPKITSWKRDGKELLKKELVPVCDVKEWADKDRDIYEKDCCIRRVLRGLKVALKDESVFQNRNSNSCLEYNISEGHWIFSEWDTWDHGLPTFTDSSDDDRQAVIDYMNKTFPRGWQS